MDLLKKLLLEAYSNKDIKPKYFNQNDDYENKIQSPILSLNNPPHFNHLLNRNMSKQDLSNTLGRQWKVLLGNLGSFIDIYQYVVTTKNFTPYIISQKSKRLNQIFKSQATVGRVLSLAVKVGLLSVAFDKPSYTKQLSKEYYYNKDIEREIKHLIEVYDINYKRSIKNNTHSINGNHLRSDNGYKVKFSSKLRIAHMTEEEALNIIYEKYPTLSKYQQMFDEMNENLPFEQQVSYTPHIEKSKGGFITKIGIRATSSICNLKVHKNNNKNYTGKWRDDYLDEYFGKGNWYENDVKSSVPRVAYLMKTGKWEDQNIDMYEKIFGKFDPETDERQAYKNFFMKFYFDYSGKLYNNNKDFFPVTSSEYGKALCSDVLKNTQKRVTDVLGESKDNEIFFHESNIYCLFTKWLRDQGIKVVQIYDGFFSNVDTSKYNYKLKEIAENYYKEVNKVINTEEDNNNKAEDNIIDTHSVNGNHLRNALNINIQIDKYDILRLFLDLMRQI